MRKRTYQHWKQRRCLDAKIRRQHKKVQKKTDDSDKKQCRKQKHQQNKNNQKTKMRRETTVWTVQATNKRKLGYGSERETLREQTESLLIAAKKTNKQTKKQKQKKPSHKKRNKAIRTNYVKVRIDKTQKIADVDYVVIERKRSVL